MIERVAALAALAMLAACAASGAPAAERAPPPPAYADNTAAPPPATVAAPNVVVAQAEPAESASRNGSDGDDDIVVPGQVERQVPPPAGDPRTASERMADIRNWDQCVMRGQNAAESDPLRPQLEAPEEACRQQLGMANRTAVPNARLQRR